MNLLRIILIILLCMLLVSVTGCATDDYPVDRNVAIMIASAGVPYTIINNTSVVTIYDVNSWTVYFLLMNKNVVTQDMLGWPESPDNTFENQGILPKGSYTLLMFRIDRKTGAVLSRTASDSVLLGGPGMFNQEPPGKIYLPLWSVIASGVGGLLIGDLAAWFIIRHRRLRG